MTSRKERYTMKEEYIEDITKLLAECEDISLLDLINRILKRCAS